MNFLEHPVTLIVIGWALGTITPIIQSHFTARLERKQILHGVGVELSELHQRLSAAVLAIELNLYGLSKGLIRWTRSRINVEMLPQSMKQFVEVTSRLLDADDGQFQAAADQYRAVQPNGVSLKSYSIPYTAAKIGELSQLPEDLQQAILQIETQLDLLNQHVEESRYYRSLTYDGSISEENHKIALAEVQRCRELVAKQSRILVEMIEALTPKLR